MLCEDIDLTRTRQVGALLDPGESEADSPPPRKL